MKVWFLSLLLVSGLASAKTYDLTHRFGVGGGAGWAFPILGNDFDDGADSDLTYNFHLRYHTSKADALQLNYQNYEFEDTAVGGEVWDLMYVVRWNEVDKFTPIFGLGAGVANMKNINPYDDNLKFAGRARLGIEYALSDDVFLSVTTDYQYIGQMPNNGEDDGRNAFKRKVPGQEIHALVPQANLTIYFGPDKEEGDHKKDDPAPAAAATAMVPDMMDDDKDGIGNDKDKCPGTAAGLTVNGYGCVPEEKAQMEIQVLFATGSSAIQAGASEQSIADLAAFMQQHPETKVEIQGHTDNTGSKTRNKTLSQARADAVRSRLVEKYQISAGRLSSYGYGDTQPVSDNNTVQGRTENRRVMAVISQ